MIRISRCLRQTINDCFKHPELKYGTVGFIPKSSLGNSWKVAKKAPMANGPLTCPPAMDGLHHKNVVMFLQGALGTFFAAACYLLTQRLALCNRKGEFYKYWNAKECKDTMTNWGCYWGIVPEWQLENAKKMKAKLAGGDDEDEDDE